MSTAPDGTPIEVQRNFGKPTRAQELAKALAEARKAKKGKDNASSARRTTDSTDDTDSGGGKTAEAADSAEPSGTKSKPTAPPAPKPTKQPRSMPSVESVVRGAPKPEAPGTPAGHEEAERTLPSGSAKSAVPQGAKRKMQVRFTGMKPMHVVEAALFAAGKPVAVEDIAEQTGLPPDKVKEGLKELQAAYQERDTVLEVGKAGAKWAMQVRSQAAEPAAKFAPMEIAPKLLKTLALIAYHQPMKQSLLVDMMGSKVYDHIPELVQRGLVRAREEGPTKILATTPLFPEYFGLDASDPEEIRALMGRLVGIEAPPRPKAETVYEDPQPQEPQAAPAQEAAPEPASH